MDDKLVQDARDAFNAKYPRIPGGYPDGAVFYCHPLILDELRMLAPNYTFIAEDD